MAIVAAPRSLWYLPPVVACLRVDDETRDELREIARGRALLIDWFVSVTQWGLRIGDVVFQWLDDTEPLPDRLMLVGDIEDPITFIRAELVPLMREEHARLRIVGPMWLGRFRRLHIDIADGGAWVDFFERGRRPSTVSR